MKREFLGNTMIISLRKSDDYNGSIIRDIGSLNAFVRCLGEMYLVPDEDYMMSVQSLNEILKVSGKIKDILI